MAKRDNCVYKHTSPSGKVYIGITCNTDNPNHRWSNGSGYAKQNHMNNAIQKYGWENFSHEVVATGLSRSDASKLEQELIAKYQSNDPDYGYNQTSGGDSNYYVSDETREKHRSAQKRFLEEHPEHISKLAEAASINTAKNWKNPEYRERIIPVLRKAHRDVYERKPELRAMAAELARLRWEDPDCRERMTNALRNRRHTQEFKDALGERFKRDVLCVETGTIFHGFGLAASFASASQTGISACCNATQETSGGYHWIYADETIELWNEKRKRFLEENKLTRGKKVLCAETGEVFQSPYFAAKSLGGNCAASYQLILRCCRGRRKTARGFHWEYVD